MLLVLEGGAQSAQEQKWKLNFDADRSGEPPSGFAFGRTGSGRLGRWIVQAEKDAPSGTKVLAQVDTDSTSYRFPVAVLNEPSFRDLRLSVRCKPISGKVDQACGLVFRYRDESNYYIVRANALEDNVRFYYVQDGKRVQLASWSGRVSSGSWHELRVDAKGDQFRFFWDGKQVLEARDTTFTDAGRIGLWTKADSVTYFDDLQVTTLAVTP
jgi:hypothetical protein